MSHLHMIVTLKEDLGDFKKGQQGLCTADLPEYPVYAVWFGDGKDDDSEQWITFKGEGARDKFEVLHAWEGKDDFDRVIDGLIGGFDNTKDEDGKTLKEFTGSWLDGDEPLP